MFIYLSKKIKVAIPNPVPLETLSWNSKEGWIACGGEDGLLKVLMLEGGEAKSGNLSMNQTLEGHSGSVRVATWNEQYMKLTTSDQYGMIIVWMLYKNQWYEEMINNRNKSVVRDMKWNGDGQRICIVYEDGAVIVGGVDGNRLWGKELRMNLTNVEWSPNGKLILFGTREGDVYVYDAEGVKLHNIQILCLEGSTGDSQLACMIWYNGAKGYVEPDCPCLAICYRNGRIQVMRNENDRTPILVDTMMDIVSAQWNDTGSILAVAGCQHIDGRDDNMVQFYTTFGEHLRSLKVPGKSLKACSWEKGSLRMALAVDHYIYFANVRPTYKWGYFANTVVYAFTKPERADHCVVFWETTLNGRSSKYVKNLIDIAAAGDHCVLVTRSEDNPDQFSLIVCNAIGTPIDSKQIDIHPLFVSMTSTHIVAASRECVYVWNYMGANQKMNDDKKAKTEKIFHIDDSSGVKDDPTKFKKAKQETHDPVCCVCMSSTMLMVARESGAVHQYSLPRVSLEVKHQLNCRPEKIALNCNSSRLAIIDFTGCLTLFDPEVKKVNEAGEVIYGEHLQSFVRKDVWDVRWATDNPELFAMMERTYMYIFRNLDPEEPILSNGHICKFEDLCVRSVNLDDIMKDPERPTRDNYEDRDIKSLRDTRVLLEGVGIDDTYAFVEQNPHPRLWRLLAEAALAKLDFDIADKAFVRSRDYQGVQIVKRLRKLDDERKQQAEVATYFGRFEDAERIYKEMNRTDLAVNLRMKLGDWFRVVKLLQAGGGSDPMMERAMNEIGNYYADRQRWEQALKYYTQGRNLGRMAQCYFRLEDYKGLESLLPQLSEGSELLGDIGAMFATVGMPTQSVAFYCKTGRIKDAINVCVSLNQWDLAVQLAKKHNIMDIDSLLAKYASHLLGKNKPLEAIELYRKANHFLDAARLLFQQAELAMKERDQGLRAKKLYVLAALQVEAFQDQQKTGSDAVSALDGLLTEDSSSQAHSRIIETAWRGAEAVHFFLLAQRQLYAGQASDALRTAARLTEYDDILDPVQAYSLLAIAALANKSYGVCSKAFIRLESLTSKQREAYEALALQIFTRHPPKDPSSESVKCMKCAARNVAWATSCQQCDIPFLPSVVSGKPMTETEFWLCGTCKHRATAPEVEGLTTCPLCHAKA
eukprot:m.90373 g.90373  ORF g.90373 m.90373 type:complete len:1153 (-) comp15261_c1_seq1:288-3746(-)